MYFGHIHPHHPLLSLLSFAYLGGFPWHPFLLQSILGLDACLRVYTVRVGGSLHSKVPLL
jgi:hypothetical protein